MLFQIFWWKLWNLLRFPTKKEKKKEEEEEKKFIVFILFKNEG